MADIDTHKHGLLGDLVAEGHAPKVTAEFGIHLANDVEEDTVVVLRNCPDGHKLRDHRRITIDLVLQEGVEVLVVRVVGHDDQEDEIGVFNCAIRSLDGGQDLLVIIILDRGREGLKEILLVLSSLIQDRADVGVLDPDVEALLQGQVVELVVNVVGVLYVFLQADDGEALKGLGLMHHRIQTV